MGFPITIPGDQADTSTVSPWPYFRWLDAITHGDPHITTFDGYRYSFQAIGEFVYLKTPVFEVQQRFEGVKGRNTAAKATSVRAGEHVIEVYHSSLSADRALVVIADGDAIEVDSEGISFDDGTYIAQRPVGWNGHDLDLIVVDPGGSYVTIEHRGLAQNVTVAVTDDLGGDISGGLAGVPDGDATNDFTLRDGSVMPIDETETIEGLYGQFASAWRVRPNERLFTRGNAEEYLTTEYTAPPVSISRLADFSGSERDGAREICLEAGVEALSSLQDCMYDVLVSGDPAWAEVAANSKAVVAAAQHASLSSPLGVSAGQRLSFNWEGPAAPNDRLFIVSPDLEESKYSTSNYHPADDGSPAELVAPADPGPYEVRYFSYADRTLLARRPLRVREPAVKIVASSDVSAGVELVVEWEGPAAPNDRLFIVSPDLGESRYLTSNYHPADAGSPAVLIAPAVPGSYEIRYFSYSNARALASVPLEVVDAKVQLDAPARVSAGAVLEFDWSGPSEPDDRIFIAPPEWEPNQYRTIQGTFHSAEEGSPARLVAPTEPGSYEIRYFSYNNRRALASVPLEVIDAEQP